MVDPSSSFSPALDNALLWVSASTVLIVSWPPLRDDAVLWCVGSCGGTGDGMFSCSGNAPPAACLRLMSGSREGESLVDVLSWCPFLMLSSWWVSVFLLSAVCLDEAFPGEGWADEWEDCLSVRDDRWREEGSMCPRAAFSASLKTQRIQETQMDGMSVNVRVSFPSSASPHRRSLKYGCLSACLALMRSSGLYASSRVRISMHSALACGRCRAMPVPSFDGKLKSR